ncbi:hypothetical protein FM105_04000 [Brevibacterium yomogidense]|uniref:Uncharacterized protein n=2 Tax=Brevibacterium yomogidense TaxID=946573 RepID=A0A1X6X592_9MICO|nr:hypothetical protein FM105_04000 [Brevibacterium yomogidense]
MDGAGLTLLLGTWSGESLRVAGHRALAPIPHRADAHWWLTAETTTPIRLRAPGLDR